MTKRNESSASPPLDDSHCPICNLPWESQCKCSYGNKTCKNNHTWYICNIHQRIALGTCVNSMNCSCPKEPGEYTVEHPEEIQDEKKSNNHIECNKCKHFIKRSHNYCHNCGQRID